MRRVSKAVAIFALFALVTTAAYADDPTDPPAIRWVPPIGVTSAEEVRSIPPIGVTFWVWLLMRVGPPIG